MNKTQQLEQMIDTMIDGFRADLPEKDRQTGEAAAQAAKLILGSLFNIEALLDKTVNGSSGYSIKISKPNPNDPMMPFCTQTGFNFTEKQAYDIVKMLEFITAHECSIEVVGEEMSCQQP